MRSRVITDLGEKLPQIIEGGYGRRGTEETESSEVQELRQNCANLLKFLDEVVGEDRCPSLRERAGKTMDLIQNQLNLYGTDMYEIMN